ncbi:uncharacterized protein MONOS_4221 [Monocercomonoides exilis]|uniref:uncharacterized protein n=1 Tax=Monocercomonoides exilis TaxID=2049356 RepID=UPI0035596B67|nr:hypothetical protein MONOS_4221 [Monocercomonoides exilis]|eukprot:MONOS_4221.1-p1 / transcript=MONOS_4221.1 / gene=MONOS_4221 / organism=Monocercomonoides_exilis_PA203 / gene_product=unspecified product / transcript_product=unspecified product / location=Mono_scaffold00109:86267-95162(-) / protein_length=2827 / sequence_SO=supercontig / SO=protein_coding / is_pseudo=false
MSHSREEKGLFSNTSEAEILAEKPSKLDTVSFFLVYPLYDQGRNDTKPWVIISWIIMTLQLWGTAGYGVNFQNIPIINQILGFLDGSAFAGLFETGFLVMNVLAMAIFLFVLLFFILCASLMKKILVSSPWILSVERTVASIYFSICFIPTLNILMTSVDCRNSVLAIQPLQVCWDTVHIIITVFSLLVFICVAFFHMYYSLLIFNMNPKRGGLNSHCNGKAAAIISLFITMQVVVTRVTMTDRGWRSILTVVPALGVLAFVMMTLPFYHIEKNVWIAVTLICYWWIRWGCEIGYWMPNNVAFIILWAVMLCIMVASSIAVALFIRKRLKMHFLLSPNCEPIVDPSDPEAITKLPKRLRNPADAQLAIRFLFEHKLCGREAWWKQKRQEAMKESLGVVGSTRPLGGMSNGMGSMNSLGEPTIQFPTGFTLSEQLDVVSKKNKVSQDHIMFAEMILMNAITYNPNDADLLLLYSVFTRVYRKYNLKADNILRRCRVLSSAVSLRFVVSSHFRSTSDDSSAMNANEDQDDRSEGDDNASTGIGMMGTGMAINSGGMGGMGREDGDATGRESTAGGLGTMGSTYYEHTNGSNNNRRNGGIKSAAAKAMLETAEKAREEAKMWAKEFWNNLLRPKINIEAIPIVLNRIATNEMIARKSYEELMATHPNNVRVLRGYAALLREIYRDDDTAETLMQQAEQIEEDQSYTYSATMSYATLQSGASMEGGGNGGGGTMGDKNMTGSVYNLAQHGSIGARGNNPNYPAMDAMSGTSEMNSVAKKRRLRRKKRKKKQLAMLEQLSGDDAKSGSGVNTGKGGVIKDSFNAFLPIQALFVLVMVGIILISYFVLEKYLSQAASNSQYITELSVLTNRIALITLYSKLLMYQVHPMYSPANTGKGFPTWLMSPDDLRAHIGELSSEVLSYLMAVYTRLNNEPWEEQDVSLVYVSYTGDVVTDDWVITRSLYDTYRSFAYSGNDVANSVSQNLDSATLFARLANIIINYPTGIMESAKRASVQYNNRIEDDLKAARVLLSLANTAGILIMLLLSALITVVSFLIANRHYVSAMRLLLSVPKNLVHQISIDLITSEADDVPVIGSSGGGGNGMLHQNMSVPDMTSRSGGGGSGGVIGSQVEVVTEGMPEIDDPALGMGIVDSATHSQRQFETRVTGSTAHQQSNTPTIIGQPMITSNSGSFRQSNEAMPQEQVPFIRVHSATTIQPNGTAAQSPQNVQPLAQSSIFPAKNLNTLSSPPSSYSPGLSSSSTPMLCKPMISAGSNLSSSPSLRPPSSLINLNMQQPRILTSHLSSGSGQYSTAAQSNGLILPSTSVNSGGVSINVPQGCAVPAINVGTSSTSASGSISATSSVSSPMNVPFVNAGIAPPTIVDSSSPSLVQTGPSDNSNMPAVIPSLSELANQDAAFMYSSSTNLQSSSAPIQQTATATVSVTSLNSNFAPVSMLQEPHEEERMESGEGGKDSSDRMSHNESGDKMEPSQNSIDDEKGQEYSARSDRKDTNESMQNPEEEMKAAEGGEKQISDRSSMFMEGGLYDNMDMYEPVMSNELKNAKEYKEKTEEELKETQNETLKKEETDRKEEPEFTPVSSFSGHNENERENEQTNEAASNENSPESATDSRRQQPSENSKAGAETSHSALPFNADPTANEGLQLSPAQFQEIRDKEDEKWLPRPSEMLQSFEKEGGMLDVNASDHDANGLSSRTLSTSLSQASFVYVVIDGKKKKKKKKKKTPKSASASEKSAAQELRVQVSSPMDGAADGMKPQSPEQSPQEPLPSNPFSTTTANELISKSSSRATPQPLPATEMGQSSDAQNAPKPISAAQSTHSLYQSQQLPVNTLSNETSSFMPPLQQTMQPMFTAPNQPASASASAQNAALNSMNSAFSDLNKNQMRRQSFSGKEAHEQFSDTWEQPSNTVRNGGELPHNRPSSDSLVRGPEGQLGRWVINGSGQPQFLPFVASPSVSSTLPASSVKTDSSTTLDQSPQPSSSSSIGINTFGVSSTTSTPGSSIIPENSITRISSPPPSSGSALMPESAQSTVPMLFVPSQAQMSPSAMPLPSVSPQPTSQIGNTASMNSQVPNGSTGFPLSPSLSSIGGLTPEFLHGLAMNDPSQQQQMLFHLMQLQLMNSPQQQQQQQNQQQSQQQAQQQQLLQEDKEKTKKSKGKRSKKNKRKGKNSESDSEEEFDSSEFESSDEENETLSMKRKKKYIKMSRTGNRSRMGRDGNMRYYEDEEEEDDSNESSDEDYDEINKKRKSKSRNHGAHGKDGTDKMKGYGKKKGKKGKSGKGMSVKVNPQTKMEQMQMQLQLQQQQQGIMLNAAVDENDKTAAAQAVRGEIEDGEWDELLMKNINKTIDAHHRIPSAVKKFHLAQIAVMALIMFATAIVFSVLLITSLSAIGTTSSSLMLGGLTEASFIQLALFIYQAGLGSGEITLVHNQSLNEKFCTSTVMCDYSHVNSSLQHLMELVKKSHAVSKLLNDAVLAGTNKTTGWIEDSRMDVATEECDQSVTMVGFATFPYRCPMLDTFAYGYTSTLSLQAQMCENPQRNVGYDTYLGYDMVRARFQRKVIDLRKAAELSHFAPIDINDTGYGFMVTSSYADTSSMLNKITLELMSSLISKVNSVRTTSITATIVECVVLMFLFVFFLISLRRAIHSIEAQTTQLMWLIPDDLNEHTVLSQEMKTGVPAMDSGRKKLFEVLALLLEAVYTQSSRAEIRQLCTELMIQAKSYFATEERMMLESNYDEEAKEKHCSEHLRLRQRLTTLSDYVSSNNSALVLGAVQLLHPIFHSHFSLLDVQFGSHYVKAMNLEVDNEDSSDDDDDEDADEAMLM